METQDESTAWSWVKKLSWETKRKLAYEEHAPPGLLAALAEDENWVIRETVAPHPALPVESMEKLGRDECWQVRARVGWNVRAPMSLLETLRKDECRSVRCDASRNKQYSDLAFEQVIERKSGEKEKEEATRSWTETR